MGFTLNSRKKPVFSTAPTQTVADLQAAADYADLVGGVLRGTSSYRESVTAGEVDLGWLFVETDTGKVYEWTASGWQYLAGGDRVTPFRSNTPIAGAGDLRAFSGVAAGTTSAGGVLTHSFPVAFSTACAGVLLMQDNESGADGDGSPLLVRASVAATGFQTFWPRRGTASVTVAYIAFGY